MFMDGLKESFFTSHCGEMFGLNPYFVYVYTLGVITTSWVKVIVVGHHEGALG